jgi:hypothetical protein
VLSYQHYHLQQQSSTQENTWQLSVYRPEHTP